MSGHRDGCSCHDVPRELSSCTCFGPDAPADTTLRDQWAWVLISHQVEWIDDTDAAPPHPGFYECGCNEDGHLNGLLLTVFDVARHQADALLPLLRAHDAQVAAQARRGGESLGLREAARRVDVGQPRIAQSLRDLADLRDRAEQDTPDQANT